MSAETISLPGAKLRSLNTRLVTMVAVMVGLVVVLILAVLFTALVSQERRVLHHQIEDKVARISASMQRAVDDVRLLSGLPVVRGIIETSASTSSRFKGVSRRAWLAQLSESFRQALEERPEFFQIRFIGAADNGMELVRVERVAQSGEIREGGLQPKGARPYVTATLKLPPKGIYLSPIDLNVEAGVLEVPHRPTLRIATPVFRDGSPFGLVIINIDMGRLLRHLEADGGDSHSFYLTNETGDFLVHPQVEKRFGFNLGQRHQIQDEFSEVGSFMSNAGLRSELVSLDPFGFRIMYLQRVQLPVSDGVRHLVVADQSEVGKLFRSSLKVWQETIGVLLVALSLVLLLAWRFARGVTRPLSSLVQATRSLADGNLMTVLPTDRTDEIGELATSFSQMADVIIEKQRALRTEAQRLLMAEEIAGLGNWAWERSNDRVSLSPVAQTLSALPETDSELSLKQMFDSIHPGDRERASAHVFGAVGSGASFDVHYRVVGSEERHVHVLGRPDSGNSERYLGTIQDVTEQVRAKAALEQYTAQLERSNRELRDFAYVASHDLQEPLRKIRAFGDRLQASYGGGLGLRGADYIERMQNAAERMSRLISDLLDYSRLSTRAQPQERVDLNRVASEVCADLSVTIEELGAQVSIETLPEVCAEPTQMRQLLQNLIANALKFHRPGVAPSVSISSQIPQALPDGLDASRPYILLSVADNGVGFDVEHLDRIFQPFQRLHGRDEYAGTGIGLATCRKIVEEHRGLITAESGLGEGSRFLVYLPACDNCAFKAKESA